MAKYLVVLSQPRLVHYRVDLFERMRHLARERDIDFRLVHGQASALERVKKDEGELAWADRVNNVFLATIGSTDLIWQPTPASLRQPDLYITGHESRILSNYAWLARRLRGGPLVAFWGHGANLQSKVPNGWRERWKRGLVNQVDYWFAYTQMSVDILRRAGFDGERITTLNNSIDTSQFRALCAAVTDKDCAALRNELNIPLTAPLGVFCGSLYPDKKLDLLVASGDIIRARQPNFHVVVVGDGPARDYLAQASRTRPWLHLVGVKFGAEKAAYFRAGQVMLNPGLLGLHILDAFCAGIPLVSTSNALHSPEISYLENNVNGLLTAGTPEAYAAGVLQILEDTGFAQRLIQKGLEASRLYTVGAMAEQYVDGIARCLQLGRRGAATLVPAETPP
ncbi:MAG TPA: glycosyltransferase family 4 protein [Patescibacteria group bacterium]|nr:glycosyltransferase family 4 protein [Patescibacteria group bacterium]